MKRRGRRVVITVGAYGLAVVAGNPEMPAAPLPAQRLLTGRVRPGLPPLRFEVEARVIGRR